MIDLANDLLSQALNLMRITGSLLLVESYSPPWAIAIPDATALAQFVRADPAAQVVAFHFVHRGCFELDSSTGEHRSINIGDLLVGFGGVAHRLYQGKPFLTVPLQDHLNGERSRLLPLTAAEPSTSTTSLICGVFVLRDTRLNPLFSALPAFLHLQRADLADGGFSFIIPDLLAHELTHQAYGSDYAVQRLLELLCLDAIRSYLNRVDHAAPGWFRGVSDPLLGKALYQFHQDPGEAWSVSRLAQAANLSPSRFAARFMEAFGESVMTYVTRWRLNRARQLLQTTDHTIDEIAHQVGYQNLPAFIRVFKRYLELSPAAWRTSQNRQQR